LEVGLLVPEQPEEPEELKLGGFLTVVGEDEEPGEFSPMTLKVRSSMLTV